MVMITLFESHISFDFKGWLRTFLDGVCAESGTEAGLSDAPLCARWCAAGQIGFSAIAGV